MSSSWKLFRAVAVGLAALALGAVVWPAPAQDEAAEEVQPRHVDLELLLAVDTSSSVSPEEFDLQMRGLSQAFRHPAVVAAIRATGDLGIAVSLIQWSDSRNQFVAVDWMEVNDETSALTFAREIDASPRFLVGGGTAIGGALQFSIRQFDRNDFDGRRKVIDLSGDGRTNQGAQPAPIRDQAVARGITVNGLAILNEDLYVDRYYRYNVIGGSGAFVMTANDYESFFDAILEKLIKEIAGAPIAQAPTPPGAVLGAAETASPPDA